MGYSINSNLVTLFGLPANLSLDEMISCLLNHLTSNIRNSLNRCDNIMMIMMYQN